LPVILMVKDKSPAHFFKRELHVRHPVSPPFLAPVRRLSANGSDA
jgi:hypothetical protein